MDLKDLEKLGKNFLPGDLSKQIETLTDGLPQGVKDAINNVIKTLSPAQLAKIASTILKNFSPDDLTGKKASKGEVARFLSDAIKDASPEDADKIIDAIKESELSE